jgi:hypothetical protein
MSSYMYPELPALNSQPAAAAAAAASSPATKMKLAKLWGMKGNSRKGWGRDPIPGSAGAPFRFQHLIPPAPQVTGRSAYKAYVSSYTQDNTQKIMGWDGLSLLQNFKAQLINDFRRHGGLKIHISALALYKKAVSADDGGLNWSVMKAPADQWDQQDWSTTHIERITSQTQIASVVSLLGEQLFELITNKQLMGSGWVFVRFQTLEMHVARYKPLKGAARMKTPPKLRAKKAVINVSTKEDDCFKWAILSALFPAKSHVDRKSNYQEHEGKLDWSGLEWPVKLDDIAKFERRNPYAVSVYGWNEEKQTPYPLRISEVRECEQHIDLVVLHEDGTGDSHYCYIKKFSAFVRQPSDGRRQSKHYCRYCLTGFPNAEKLAEHTSLGCAQITESLPDMPKPKDAFIEFENHDKKFPAPFVIYADFECLTIPLQKCERSGEESYTDEYQQHEPCGFCYYVVAADGVMREPVVYRGPDAVDQFITQLLDTQYELIKLVKQNVKMVMTAEDEADFKSAVCCSICEKPLGDDRVRDHDHMTGQYRGAAHSKCNIEEGKTRTRNFQIPVFFHNLKGYDAHLIMSKVGKYTSKLSAIPQNYEKMISFSFSNLRFLDSAAFLSASLVLLIQASQTPRTQPQPDCSRQLTHETCYVSERSCMIAGWMASWLTA